MLEELRDKLVAHINEVGAKEGRERDKKLKELLVKSFPVVRNNKIEFNKFGIVIWRVCIFY